MTEEYLNPARPAHVAVPPQIEPQGPVCRVGGVVDADSRGDGDVVVRDLDVALRQEERVAVETDAVERTVDGQCGGELARAVRQIELPLRFRAALPHRID